MPGHHFLHCMPQDGTWRSTLFPTSTYWGTGSNAKEQMSPTGSTMPCPAALRAQQHAGTTEVRTELKMRAPPGLRHQSLHKQNFTNVTAYYSHLLIPVPTAFASHIWPQNTFHVVKCAPPVTSLSNLAVLESFPPLPFACGLNHSLCELYFWIYEKPF